MKLKSLFYTVLTTALLLNLCSCSKNDETDISSGNGNRSQRNSQQNQTDYTVFEFVHSISYYYYLWNSNIPSQSSSSYYSQFEDPEEMFETFIDSRDRYSFVMNNYSEVYSELDNDYSTDGINYSLYYGDSNKSTVIATVNYVYDDSPAQSAGIKRGDVITAIDGTTLTPSNYQELLAKTSYTLTYKKIVTDDEGEISYSSDTYTSSLITKKQMTINPILQNKLITRNGKRIGYLLYDSFTMSATEIVDACEKLQSWQIDELVLDLRLNSGGYVSTLDTLASLIVPEGNAGKVFIQSVYNSYLTQYYKKYQNEMDQDPFYTYFTEQNANLNLKRLYVLTSNTTASASEELISGLKPYMDVILIGETTTGKYTSCYLINDDEDEGSDSNGIPYSEWAVYLVVGSCTDSNGNMDFENGWTPDYEIEDTYCYELGDEEEPLLAQALTLIDGGSIAKRTTQKFQKNSNYIGNYGKPEVLKQLIITHDDFI